MPEELANKIKIEQLGSPVYRTKQLLFWLYKSYINEPDKMSNLPAEFKTYLLNNYSFYLPETDSKHVSSDKAIKYRIK